MWTFNLIFSKIFDFIFFAFRSLSPWVGMIVISFLTGLLVLVVYRYASNQEGIKRVKNKFKAHLLEIRLFKDSLLNTFKAQGSLFMCSFKYMSYGLKPALVMIIPFILIFMQLIFWFGFQSLSLGETAILKVKLPEDMSLFNIDISVEPSSGILIDTPPLRIEEEREINWRLRAKEKGLHDLIIKVNNQKIIKKVSVEEKPLTKISPIKVQRNFWDELMNPMEAPIGRDIPVKSVEISYPPKYMNFFGWNIHWIIYGSNMLWIIAWFFLSFIFIFVFKGFFKVEL